LRIGLADGLKDGADGGPGGEDIVDDEPVTGGIGKQGGMDSVDAVESLKLFFAAGF